MDISAIQSRRRFLERLCAVVSSLAVCGVRAIAGGVGQDGRDDARLMAEVSEGLPLTRRADWAMDVSPRVVRMRRAVTFDRLTIHHWGVSIRGIDPGVNSVMHRLDGILGGHIARNYGDIGYHFVIDHAGRVWEGRSLRFEGAHVARHNQRNLGVMLLGNFEQERPSASQLGSLKKLTALLLGHFDIDGGRVYGHCDLASSVCPGRFLHTHVRHMRRKVPA